MEVVPVAPEGLCCRLDNITYSYRESNAALVTWEVEYEYIN
jgi:hypothetical protein